MAEFLHIVNMTQWLKCCYH